jgi:hypothetical protein
MVLDELFVPERVAAWVGGGHRLSGRSLEMAQARSG